MITGYSLSPGGLLFPYHIGTLTALSQKEYLTPSNPLAGSSAGAIAAVTHATNLSPEEALEATVRMSETCERRGVGARGNLLPLLRAELEESLAEDAHEVLNERRGVVGVAYRELFPRNRSVLETRFDSKECLVDAVCNSAMFPFFSTSWPFRFARRKQLRRRRRRSAGDGIVGDGGWDVGLALPRIAVDGYFTVPRERFGCPDFDMLRNGDIYGDEDIDGDDPFMDSKSNQVMDEEEEEDDALDQESKSLQSKPKSKSKPKPNEVVVDRTITISVFPHSTIGLTASNEHDQISPLPAAAFSKDQDQMSRLLRLATQTASREEYYQLYEDGWKDAERWMAEEERRGYWGLSSEQRRNIYADTILKEEDDDNLLN